MPEILVDLYKIKELYSGLGQFSKNFGRHLSSIENQLDFEIEYLLPKDVNFDFKSKTPKISHTSLVKRHIPSLGKKYDLWHSLQQFPSFVPKKNTPWMLTIHDLNYLTEKEGSKRDKYHNQLQKNLDKADVLTAISHFTKSEIENNLNTRGKEIHVIHNGVEFSENQRKPEFIKEESFFFSIGIFNAKKNFEILLPLMAHFPDKKLIIAGNNNTSYGKEIKAQLQNSPYKNQIILPGKIDDQEKNWLYANCDAFLFPSLAEGFGLPVIEAMFHKAPTFCSNHCSLPEVGGSAANYFENFDTQYMAVTINKGLMAIQNNPSLKEDLRTHALQFSWENAINQYATLYKNILG